MIAAGTKLGVYELIGPLGTGAMGEVYRARDTRLGREVAVKVLPPALAANPASLARFEQEARHVAALNHPGIVNVFDVGTRDGVAYIVSELVDGATLRGADLSVRKAAEVGAQIADALAAAHAAGVTHRDIKPANVMVTRDGRVKLLDFGVARASGGRASDAPTLGDTGSVVGTAGYMAPEQVRGEVADARADIFAVGALVHELLAGAPAFTGGTAVEIMAATLHADPPELPDRVPDGLQRIVRRCLEKNPEERFQSARDLAFALRQLAGTSAAAADPIPAGRARSGSRAWMMAAAGFLLGMVVTGAVLLRSSADGDAAIDPIRLTRLTGDPRDELWPAFSPDGRSLAYVRVGGRVAELLVRPLDAADAIVVVRSNTTLRPPVWTSDGSQVCYSDVARDLWCVGAAGGTPRRVLQDAYRPQPAPGGGLFFVRVFQGQPWLFHRAAPAAEPRRVGESLPATVSVVSPVSPNGSGLVVASESARWLVSLPGGGRAALPSESGARARSIGWLPDSRHIVVSETTTPLIGSRLVIQDTRSAARRLVLHTADHIEAIAASPDGTRLVYAGGPVERDVVEYGSDGKYVRTVAAASILEGFPAWAPAGDGFVYRAGGPGQADSLWYGRSAGSPATLVQRLGSNASSRTPVSPDGQRIAYVDRTGLHVVSVAGGRAVRLVSSATIGAGVCWAADGEWIWYSEGPTRLGRVPSGGGEPIAVPAASGVLLDCSPDGRWLARLGADGIVLTATDGTDERPIGAAGSYATRAENVAQFGERGRVLYLLGLDHRTIDVLEVDGGRKLRTITFDIPVEDQIEGFSFNPDGTRVLLSTGGDRNDLWMVEGFAQPGAAWTRWFRHWKSAGAAPAR